MKHVLALPHDINYNSANSSYSPSLGADVDSMSVSLSAAHDVSSKMQCSVPHQRSGTMGCSDRTS